MTGLDFGLAMHLNDRMFETHLSTPLRRAPAAPGAAAAQGGSLHALGAEKLQPVARRPPVDLAVHTQVP
jgi:hypothetical protein